MRHCEPGPPGVDEGGGGAGGSSKLIGRPSLRSWLSSRELIGGFDIILIKRKPWNTGRENTPCRELVVWRFSSSQFRGSKRNQPRHL